MKNIAIVAFALIIVSCSAPKKEVKQEKVVKSVRPEDFQLETLDGEPLYMPAYKGKTIFINVWATWCKPCIKEMPSIAAVIEKLRDPNIVFLFASNEDVKRIEEFRDARKFPLAYVRLRNLEALSIQALPATFIFSPEGAMVFGEEGYRDWNTDENIAIIMQTIVKTQ